MTSPPDPPTASERPWWQVAVLAGVAAMAVSVVALLIPPGWGLAVLGAGVVAFVVVLLNNPAYWLRRLTGACFAAAIATAATPRIAGALDLGSLGVVLVEFGADIWIALSFLAAGVALAVLAEKRHISRALPAGDDAPQSLHAGVHASGRASVTAGEITGGDKHLRDAIGPGGVVYNIEGGATFNHSASPAELGSPADAVDLEAYLRVLLAHVEHIDIAGISSRPGRSEEVIFRPIEELYTPLTTLAHRGSKREQGHERPPEAPRRVALPEVLPGCLCDDGGRRRVNLLIRRVLAEAVSGDLASEARVVGVVGRMLATLTVYDYPLHPKLAATYQVMRTRVMAIFTREGAARVELEARVAAAETLGKAGDPRFAEGVDNFVEVPWIEAKVGRYPVTVCEFARFVDDEDGYMRRENWDDGGWSWRERYGRESAGSWEEQLEHPTRPVTEVSWWEARAYCRWRSSQLEQTVRLPLEEEWKMVASAGGTREFPWGDEAPTPERANFAKHVGAPTPVGIYPAGSLWLHGGDFIADLAGNVDECCEDGRKGEEDKRWIKGGSWYDEERGALAVAYRYWYWIVGGDYDLVGFRVVLLPASR